MTPEEIAAYKADLLRRRNAGAGMMIQSDLGQQGQSIYQDATRAQTPRIQNLGMGVMANQFGESRQDPVLAKALASTRDYERGLVEDDRSYQSDLLTDERAYQEGVSETAHERELELARIKSASSPSNRKIQEEIVASDRAAGELKDVRERLSGQPSSSTALGRVGTTLAGGLPFVGPLAKEGVKSLAYNLDERAAQAATSNVVEIIRRARAGANLTVAEEDFVNKYMPNPDLHSVDVQMTYLDTIIEFFEARARGDRDRLSGMMTASGITPDYGEGGGGVRRYNPETNTLE